MSLVPVQYPLRIEPVRILCLRNSRRGGTLVETMAALLILAFVTIASVSLYRVGDKQQRTARFYSDAQTTARETLRRIIRTARHASAIETGTTTFYNSITPSSGSAQLIVTVPKSGAAGSDHVRFYLSGTTLYGQRSDDTNAGLVLATGVSSLAFAYTKTAASGSTVTATSADASPQTATEAQITLTVSKNGIATTETVYVTFRNVVVGM